MLICIESYSHCDTKEENTEYSIVNRNFAIKITIECDSIGDWLYDVLDRYKILDGKIFVASEPNYTWIGAVLKGKFYPTSDTESVIKVEMK